MKIQKEFPPKVETVNDSMIKFTVTIQALVDDLDDADLKALMSNRPALDEATRKYKELQEKYDALLAEMATLKRDYDTASETRKIEIKREVARNTEEFSAVDAMARANDFYFAKNFGQAITAYDEAIRLNPQFAEAYNNRGIVKYEMGRYAEAVADYSTAVSLKPNFVNALNNRGNAQADLGQLQPAAQDLQAALRLDGNSAIIRNNLGNVYYLMQNYDAALNEYTRAIALNPNIAEVYYNRAAIYYGLRRYNEALADIKKSMALNPSDGATRDLYEKINSKVV